MTGVAGRPRIVENHTDLYQSTVGLRRRL